MPISKPPSPVCMHPEIHFELDNDSKKRLAPLLGLPVLQDDCIAALNEIFTQYLTLQKIIAGQQNKTTVANVKASLEKLIGDITPLVKENCGLDIVTFEYLSPHIHSLLEIANKRIAELDAHPRIIPEREMLRITCPQLRLFFEEAAMPELRYDRPSLRKFAFEALNSAKIKSGIDEAHLDRLDEFLNAEYSLDYIRQYIAQTKVQKSPPSLV